MFVHFKPPAPGKYLLDFTVENDLMLAEAPIQYTLLTGASLKQTSQMLGSHEHKISHVTFLVDFTDTQQKPLALYSDYGWTFYQCEISQVK